MNMNRSCFKLSRLPAVVKIYVGFVLFVSILIGLINFHAYINRPEQMQSLQLYEQKLETISSKKVNEKYYASGRASIDDVKEILSKQNIGWNEISKNRIVGHDYDTNVYIELFKERGSNKVILILQKRN